MMVECILEAATRVLEKHGLNRYNTTTIAEEAGASVGSIYQYFPNRDAVTAALILRAHQQLLADLRAAIGSTDGLALKPAIMAIIGVGLPKSSGARKVARLLEVEEERIPRTPELLEAEAQILSLNLGFLRRYLPQELPDASLEIASFDMVSIVRGMIDASLIRGDYESDQLIERISHAVIGYLEPLIARSVLRAPRETNANRPGAKHLIG